MKISQLFCVVGVASLALLPLSSNAKTIKRESHCKLGSEYIGVPKGSEQACIKRCGGNFKNGKFRVVMTSFVDERRHGNGDILQVTHICPVTAGDKSRPFDKKIYGKDKYLYAVTQCSCSANY